MCVFVKNGIVSSFVFCACYDVKATNDGDNPPVYFFEESYDEVYTQGDFIKLSDTFSEYLIKKYNGELLRY
ncbi:hypothetical protein ACIQ57_16870 [Lysinibacillus xylanilyticus]|uniref:hypothetical protein n=1 Tax=Lysinibacillus xylanilyticus TaxID=582475 RepID=UPI0037F9545F